MRKSVFTMLLFSMLTFTACSSASVSSGGSSKDASSTGTEGGKIDVPSASAGVYTTITPEEVQKLLDSDASFILLDVRTEEEFAESHIEGAVLIPNYDLGSRAAKDLPDKNALIIVYCRSGQRSSVAAKELIAMGYKNVFDLGGIIDWPYETVKG